MSLTINQGASSLPVDYVVYAKTPVTTLDPYTLNMYLDYGPVEIYNDDRTIDEADRGTYSGWYFSPKVDGSTISLFEGELIVMYVQIQNPTTPNEFESWSCSARYEMANTVYVG